MTPEDYVRAGLIQNKLEVFEEILQAHEDLKGRIHRATETVKEAYRKKHPGGCRMLSQGNGCRCVLCLCDEIHAILDVPK